MDKYNELSQNAYTYMNILESINSELDKLQSYISPIIQPTVLEETAKSNLEEEKTELLYWMSHVLWRIRILNDTIKL